MGRLSGEVRERVWELWRQGKGYSEIACSVGKPPGSVFTILRENGGLGYRVKCPGNRALTLADREEISRGLAAGLSFHAIAQIIGKSPSTVSREVARNNGRNKYRALQAHKRAARARMRPQKLCLEKNPVLRNYVVARLKLGWSPEQIAKRLKHDYPRNQRMHISHEAIYRAVYLHRTRPALPWGIHQYLRRAHPIRYGKSYSVRGQWRSIIKDAKSIHDRPAHVDQRLDVGHWEGDLVIGSNMSQIATLVERRTRYTIIIALKNRTTTEVVDKLIQRITNDQTIPFKTLTWDRGMELADHKRLTRETGVNVYFADPHSPWQRGSNENTNGLIRQYLPKKTDLALHSQTDLDHIAHKLNTRPRKTLNYLTPNETHTQLLH